MTFDSSNFQMPEEKNDYPKEINSYRIMHLIFLIF